MPDRSPVSGAGSSRGSGRTYLIENPCAGSVRSTTESGWRLSGTTLFPYRRVGLIPRTTANPCASGAVMTRQKQKLNVGFSAVGDGLDETHARAWCESLARRLPVQHIPRGTIPYLSRYYVAGWSPTNRQSGPAVFLHHFVAS